MSWHWCTFDKTATSAALNGYKQHKGEHHMKRRLLGSIASMIFSCIVLVGYASAAEPCFINVSSGPEEGSLTVILGSVSSQASEATPTRQLRDTDCDGLPDSACLECTPTYVADNCKDNPNGPDLGTCTAGSQGMLGEPCLADAECGSGGECSMAQEDSDSDGFGDACDYCDGNGVLDQDSDGLCDGDDNCPTVQNLLQDDSDDDGLGDVCDYCDGNGALDQDSDGLCDGDDNCPTAPNPLQVDTDNDSYGDECSGAIDRIAPIENFTGTWREIGRQVGSTYPDNIIYFGQLFQEILSYSELSGWTPQDYYNETKQLIPQSVTDHMEGMAEGLIDVRPISPPIAWDLVLAQNMAVDLLNMERNMSPLPDPPVAQILNALRGCTGFGVSSSVGTFLAHNTDAQGVAGVNTSTVMYWYPSNGDYAYLTFDPPGWADVAFGLNQKGIAVTVNAGSPNSDAVIGYYYTFMTRYAMEHAATLKEAVKIFTDVFKRGENFGPTGALIHFTDFNTGKMAKIQLRSEFIEVTYGEERVPGVVSIGSANHFVGDFNPDPSYYYESSFMRYDRLLDLLNDATASFDLDGSWDILRDTNDGTPEDDGIADSNTISRQGAGFGAGSTTFGTIFTPDGMYYALGRPDAYFDQYPGAQFVAGVRALSIKHKKLSSEKLEKKAKKVTLKITGTAGFDIHGRIDLGPLTWKTSSFSKRKNLLKIKAIVPAGLEPGSIQISVGDYIGWIQVD